MNEDQQKLADVLEACCKRLDDVEEAPLMYLDDVVKVCAHLRPAVASADTPEMLCMQNLLYRTEEWVLTWVLRGRYSEQDMPAWLLGDVESDHAAWQAARRELAEIRGEA